MILLSTIQDNILRNIPRDTSKNNWNALTTKYKSNNVQNIVSLRRRLMNSKHGNNETIYVAIVILQGLSQEYDNFVQVLTLDAKTLKVDDIAISLIQEEQNGSHIQRL
jgi:hypothetical protein